MAAIRLRTSQRIVLLLGVLLMAGMCLWPPCINESRFGSGIEYKAVWGSKADISFSRLVLQEVAVAGATIGVAFLGIPLAALAKPSWNDLWRRNH